MISWKNGILVKSKRVTPYVCFLADDASCYGRHLHTLSWQFIHRLSISSTTLDVASVSSTSPA